MVYSSGPARQDAGRSPGDEAMAQDRGSEPRLPPNDREAERCVLGSMLRDNEVIGEVVQVLKAEHFYAFAHQKLFEAIAALVVDRGVPADPVTLANYLNEQQLLQDV